MVKTILSVSERVVQSVATETDTDPLELPQLYETIDPDALDTFVSVTADGEVCFRYAGYAVTVESSGAVHVDDRLTASDVSEDVGSDVEIDHERLRRCQIGLYDKEVPKLAAAGLVEFDADRRTVSLAESAPAPSSDTSRNDSMASQ